ncbi:endolytic transglycosylase MltG [Curtobacterium sp. VKM Ac-2865]|uniref:endolytic transglycosylase MltG n=1 Tax=Curtobacterium sp. VKM Ac-2865 TaxID=2783817 RepID=UPI00188C9992|nr:endolytic transglycosylase MltG [Curtobacterium sp. VKM Ac-2865]MBF4581275.1 endolytic transglycosylase MltG [Curtobacterium sp. VKM Ac-2865]
MADDLDWNAIIAPGNDADRRGHSTRRDGASDDRTDSPGDADPSAGRPLSRREARAREAAAARDAETAGTTAPRPTTQQQAPQQRTPQEPTAPAPAPEVRSPFDAAASARGADTDTAHHDDLATLAAPAAATDSGGADGGTGDGAAGGGGGDRGDGGGGASRPPRGPHEPHRRSRGALIAGIVIVAIVVAAGVGAYAFAAPKVQQVVAAFTGSREPDDYSGTGTSKVTITIKQGDIGEDVAKTLQRSGVVKTSGVFYKLLLQSPSVQFQPGSYALKKKMSSKAALAALEDRANRVEDASIVIPEGTVLADIEAGMVSKAGLTKAEVSAAAKDVGAYGLPSGVTSLEGWLFPATYPINPGWSAKQYFQSMVDTMKQHLQSAGVAEADQEKVLVFASLVQKEAGLAADYPKVARVFQNRLDQGMRLQSDATVAYGTGNTHRVTTTDAERNDASNRYNTYQHDGLPPGPISNPGDIALQAVTHPAEGKWLYFVTVDLESGETTFSDTYDEHLQAVKQFQAWLRAHPSYQ